MANYKKQMEMFDLGGLKDQGETTDRKSRNKVPVGSLKKEVRDDVPINISEGEFVLPADVVRYHGLEKIMNLRQNAKSGLELMNKMGQMGNSDQATLPDNIPFQPQNYQQGGIAVQNPQVQNPQIIPDVQQQNQVPGINYAPPNQLALRPSIYSQQGQQPIVKPQPPKQPQVKLPDSPTYGQPNYRLPTGTASTSPTFSGLIGAQFGQLQKSETKKYVNPETGEELFIPFVNGEPVYPIPTGFIFEADVKEEEKKEEAGEVKTTSVRDEGEGGDDAVDTTSVTGGFYNDPQTYDYDLTEDELADLAAGKTPSIQDFGKMSLRGGLKDPANVTSQTRGVSVIDKALADLGVFGQNVMGAIGSLFSTDEQEKGISTTVQSDRLGSLGYNTNASKNSFANSLGLDLTDKNTMAIGHNPGNQNPNNKDEVYSKSGVAVNMNPNSLGYLSSTGFSNRNSFFGAMGKAYDTGYYGTLSSNINAAVMHPELTALENSYRSALGIPNLDVDKAIEQLNQMNPTQNYGKSLGKGAMISYTTTGKPSDVSFGSWGRNELGQLQFSKTDAKGNPMGTVLSNVQNPKGGYTIGNFKTTNPNVQTPSDKGSIDKGKGINTISIDPSVGTPSPKGTIDDDVVGIGKGVTGSGVPGLGIDTTGISSGISDDSFSDSSPTSSPDTETSTVGDDPSGAGDEGVGTESATDMGYSTAQGGFISRRKATKIKSKKQGGLASRR
jgi:hypothetical protein